MMKQELDFSGREQLYYQIYDIMFQEIVNGKYAEKDLLPAESELMERYGVSPGHGSAGHGSFEG